MPDPAPATILHTGSSLEIQPRRILVRGVNWLGDSVMSTPAVQRLRQRYPQSRISLLTTDQLAPLWLQHPAVDQVLTFAKGESAFAVSARLRAEGFDLAVVFPNSPRSALETWLAGIPRRIGYARSWRRWLLTQLVAPRAARVGMKKRSVREVEQAIRACSNIAQPISRSPIRNHQMNDYLDLVGALGAETAALAPRLEVLPAEMEAAEAAWLIRPEDVPAGNIPNPEPIFVGISPSAAYGQAKRWPAENFAAVAHEVSRKVKNCRWLLFGSAADGPLCEEISRRVEGGLLNLAGKTSLRELMALLKRCRVLLTNDSGPMHVAAAVGTPVVALFGSTSWELTGPGLPGDIRHQILRSDAACSPCFRRTCPIDFRCMRKISVEMAVKSVLTAIVR